MKNVAATSGQSVSLAMPIGEEAPREQISAEEFASLNLGRTCAGRFGVPRNCAGRTSSYRAEYGTARAMQGKYAPHRAIFSRRWVGSVNVPLSRDPSTAGTRSRSLSLPLLTRLELKKLDRVLARPGAVAQALVQ